MRFRPGGLVRTLLKTAVAGPFLRIFFGVNVSGSEHFGGLERFILVANHNSHLDVLVLLCAVPARMISRVRPVAAADYFGKSRLAARVIEAVLEPVWINRGGSGTDAIEAMGRVLREGGSLIVFPEGTRGEPGEMTRFRSGIGRLVADNPGVAIVPAYISGPERSLPKGSFLPVPLWSSVTVGPPMVGSGAAGAIARAAESAVRDLGRAAEAGRHRRAPRRERSTRMAAVLGIDGSGKSTVSRRLAELASRGATSAWLSDTLELFEDGRPRDCQPLVTDELRKAIGRSAKRAGSLKAYRIPKLAELLLRNRLLGEIERWFSPRVAVLDGSPLLNLAAWSVLYRGELGQEDCARAIFAMEGERPMESSDPLFGKYPELLALRRAGLARLRRPDAVVLLDLPAETAVGRIMARGGETQAHETEERLARLSASYRTVCEVTGKTMGIPTLKIDGRRPLDEVVREADEFVRRAFRDG